MMLSELSHRLESIQASAPAKDAEQFDVLLNQIRVWRDDARTPRDLLATMWRGLGGIWLSTRALHQDVYDAIESFGRTVDELGGMTMNERLVMFDLIDSWDAGNSEDRELLYAKLEAKPGRGA